MFCTFLQSTCFVTYVYLPNGLQAWQNAIPTADAYKHYADRWGSGGFGDYCKSLEKLVDNALQQASQVQVTAALRHVQLGCLTIRI